ncbi:MAG: sugar transferase [Acidobacteria bacterium]|nr:sugar transferase [Acidobacteriota bacterium]
MRRLGERLIACVLLVLTAPLMMIILLAIKCLDGGPVLQTRQRIGQDGPSFQMLSFRTTLHDRRQMRSLWQPTRIGQFLRTTRMEALPQIVNVLHGDMFLAEMTFFD